MPYEMRVPLPVVILLVSIPIIMNLRMIISWKSNVNVGVTTHTVEKITPGDEDPFQDWIDRHTHIYPGRFNQTEYDNMTVEVWYNPNKDASPHTRDDCAPGLLCKFSDRSWHETGWHKQFVFYATSIKRPNAVHVSVESHARNPKETPADVYQGFAGIATTDLRSDIPIALLNHPIKSYYERPQSQNVTKRKILYVQSNCRRVTSGRDLVIRKLMSRGLVDSYGKCHNNAAIPDWLSKYTRQQQKQELIKMYAFTAAFENSIYPGYATEKIWEPLWFGSVPINLGSPNARMFLPDKSTIYVDNFDTVDSLAEYIEYLIRNHTAYNFYHSWRLHDPPKRLVDLWKFDEQPIDCRLCRWGAENLY